MNIKNVNQIRKFLYPIVWIYMSVPVNARSFTTEIYPIATTGISTVSTEYPLTRYIYLHFIIFHIYIYRHFANIFQSIIFIYNNLL